MDLRLTHTHKKEHTPLAALHARAQCQALTHQTCRAHHANITQRERNDYVPRAVANVFTNKKGVFVDRQRLLDALNVRIGSPPAC